MSEPERTDGGDGLPGCKICGGRGAIDVEAPEPQKGEVKLLQIGRVRPCKCVYANRLLLNLSRGWKAAVKAPRLPTSPLLKLTGESLWITASPVTMQAHVKHVALRQHPDWDFLATSDSDLVVAWLGNIALKRGDIHDHEVAERVAKKSLEHHSLADLVNPPELLIIQLGVKAAKNSETPGVLEEAIRSRHSEDKPTWVFDQPNRPYMPGHIAYDEDIEEYMECHFKRVNLSSLGKSARARARVTTAVSTGQSAGNVPTQSFSLSDLSGDSGGGTKELRKPRRQAPTKKK